MTVCAGGVMPDEKGFLVLDGPLHEVDGLRKRLIVIGLHALDSHLTQVLDLLLSDDAPSRVVGVVGLVCRPGMDNVPGPEFLEELRIFRVVHVLRLLQRVQVVEHAGILVEAVDRGQVLIPVSEVVLAELVGGVTVGLEQLRKGRVLVTDARLGAGHTHLGQTDAERALACDKGRTAGCAALLAVVIREHGAFFGDAVDVRGLVPHQPMAVGADICDTDIVAHDDKDVGLVSRIGCADGQTKSEHQCRDHNRCGGSFNQFYLDVSLSFSVDCFYPSAIVPAE